MRSVASMVTMTRSALLIALALSLNSAQTFPIGAKTTVLRAEIVVGAHPVGTISKELFGANLLWADNAEGAFDPSTDSFYPGFVSLMRRLGISALRYPAGITSDSFFWQRAVGPLADRLPNEPYGVQGLSPSCCVVSGPQPSVVGPDEYGQLLDELSAQGTVTVNFATGTATEAADFVAYMTAPVPKVPTTNPRSPGYWAELRARYGHPAPYDVPVWEVGNEQFSPSQFGWRSGKLVGYGPGGASACPAGTLDVPTCLYVFGGTTRFSRQYLGRFANELPSAALSDGKANQRFYVYYPPVQPGTVTVWVAGHPWRRVTSLLSAGPRAPVYTIDWSTGEVTFGNGNQGAIPPKGALVQASYDSGPHEGFIGFYEAMKAMNPHIQVCESEGPNTDFMALMGESHSYDCVILHEYLVSPGPLLPLRTYEEDLTAGPLVEGYSIEEIQEAAKFYAGRAVPVYVTEYGQPVSPRPLVDQSWNLSLGEGLSTAEQLIEFAYHHVVLAEKYLAVSEPFGTLAGTGYPDVLPSKLELRRRILRLLSVLDGVTIKSGLSPDNALIAHVGPYFVAEPSGLVIRLLSRLGGARILPANVIGGALLGGGQAPELWALAASARKAFYLAVVNANPESPVDVTVKLPALATGSDVVSYTLDGPSLSSYNSVSRPAVVSVAAKKEVLHARDFTWRLDEHSVTLFMMSSRLRPAS